MDKGRDLDKISLDSNSCSESSEQLLKSENFKTQQDFNRYTLLTSDSQQKKDEAGENLFNTVEKQKYPLIFSRNASEAGALSHAEQKKITIPKGEYSPFPRSNSGGSSSPTMIKLRRSSQPIPIPNNIRINEEATPLLNSKEHGSSTSPTSKGYQIF